MENYKTEQEAFWAGEFGNDYSKRNIGDSWVASNAALFLSIFKRTINVKSVLEFGANIGLNLKAIQTILPKVELSAIEINSNAIKVLKDWAHETVTVYSCSIIDFKLDYQRDFVFSKGVLIHINPEFLPIVYQLLYESSSRYICIAEYYNPSPVTINYRGNENKLFKRDFAGELMDRYSDLKLVDYGFSYHRDNNYPQDDLTWFLFSK